MENCNIKTEHPSFDYGFEFVAVNETIKTEVLDESDYLAPSTATRNIEDQVNNGTISDTITHALTIEDGCTIKEEFVKPELIIEEVGKLNQHFKCLQCELSFLTADLLTTHVNETHNFNHNCTDCFQYFTNAFELNNHIQSLHTEIKPNQLLKKKYVCLTLNCFVSFPSQMQLYHHMQLTHGVTKPHACVLCDKRFYTETMLKYHRYYHKQKAVACSICNKVCRSENGLRSHINNKHNKFTCGICRVRFTSADYLTAHVTASHAKLRKPRRTKASYRCPSCRVMFDNQMTFVSHKCGLTLDPCEFCGQVCESLPALARHKQMHEQILYSCRLCNRRSNTARKVALCELRHGEKKTEVIFRMRQGCRYQCADCHTCFRLKHKLREHVAKCSAGSEV